MKGQPNEYGVSISNFKQWPSSTIMPRNRLAEAMQSASAGKPTSFAPVVRSLALRKIHVCDPGEQYGIQTPCAYHGWGCAVQRRRWNQRLRRVGDMSVDEVLTSGIYHCMSLRRDKTVAYRDYQSLSMDPKRPAHGPKTEEGREAWSSAQSKYNGIRCQFTSTDPRLFELYQAHTSYAWVALSFPATCRRQVAMTQNWVDQLDELVMHTNPNAIADIVRRSKEKMHTKRVAALHSAQLLARRWQLRSVADAPNEPIQGVALSFAELGGWLPSDNTIRDVLLERCESMVPYMERFTTSHCLIGSKLAADDSGKVGKGTGVWKKTVMNEYGLVEMSMFDKSTSFDSPRAQRMGREWCEARGQMGAPPLVVRYLDNPENDGGGFRRMKQAAERNAKPLFVFSGAITVVETPEQDARALQVLSSASVLGFDTEHVAYVPPVPQGPPGKNVATVQLVKDGQECFIWLPHRNGYPGGLKSLLGDPRIEKVASNVSTDVSRLSKDGIRVSGSVDLIGSVKAVKLSPRLSRHKLEVLVFHPQLLDAVVHKSIEHHLWEAHPLSSRQLEYAATDSLAHLAVYNKCKVLLAQQSGQPPPSSSFLWKSPDLSTQDDDDRQNSENEMDEDDHESKERNDGEQLESQNPPQSARAERAERRAARAARLDAEMGKHEELGASDGEREFVVAPTGASVPGESDEELSEPSSASSDSNAAGTDVLLYLAAEKAIIRYAEGDDPKPLHLPPGIPSDLRKWLYAVAANHGLESESSEATSPSGGGGVDRHIVVSRWMSPRVGIERNGEDLIGCQGARAGTDGQAARDRWRITGFSPSGAGLWTVRYGDESTEQLGVAKLNDGMRSRHMGDMIAARVQGTDALSFKEGAVGGFPTTEVQRMTGLIDEGAEGCIDKVDIFHWMADVIAQCVKNKHSPVLPFFANALSDSIFRIMTSERERRIKHYLKLNMTPHQISNLRRRHFRPYCRLGQQP